MRKLLLDLELAPNLATVWGLWGQNIAINQLINDSYVLTWSAKWHGSDDVEYSSLRFAEHEDMIRSIYDLINEADMVISYNGDRFDLKILNQEFLMCGLGPPRPYKSVDLLKTMKKNFRGTSNKLDYWLNKLSLGAKVKHRGHQLWLDCMNGKASAFKEMEEYNIGDVVELEKLYDYVLPWIPNHPVVGAYNGTCSCPSCGGTKLRREGWRVTKTRKYRRFVCTECGKWTHENKSEAITEIVMVPDNG